MKTIRIIVRDKGSVDLSLGKIFLSLAYAYKS